MADGWWLLIVSYSVGVYCMVYSGRLAGNDTQCIYMYCIAGNLASVKFGNWLSVGIGEI